MKNKKLLILPLILIIAFAFSNNIFLNCKSEKKNSALTITCKAFAEAEMIPAKYTCDAENISPEILWTKGPDKTKAYALICDDPDAPSKVWVHWVVYNIPADVTELNEKFSTDSIYKNIKNGINDFGTFGYSGPCPPSGIHHYKFKIYALDCNLNLKAASTKAQLEAAMKNHILANGTLTGLYKRK